MQNIHFVTKNTRNTRKKDMVSVENCSIVRPLLAVSRFETGKVCSFWKLPIYPDTSNKNVKFLRNRVRKQFLPIIKLFFNSRIESVIVQFAEIVEAEDQYLHQITKQLSVPFSQLWFTPENLLKDFFFKSMPDVYSQNFVIGDKTGTAHGRNLLNFHIERPYEAIMELRLNNERGLPKRNLLILKESNSNNQTLRSPEWFVTNLKELKFHNWFVAKHIIAKANNKIFIFNPLYKNCKVSFHFLENLKFLQKQLQLSTLKLKKNFFLYSAFKLNKEFTNSFCELGGNLQSSTLKATPLIVTTCILTPTSQIRKTKALTKLASTDMETWPAFPLVCGAKQFFRACLPFHTEGKVVDRSIEKNVVCPIFRFSVPLRMSFWISNKRVGTKKIISNTLKTEIENANFIKLLKAKTSGDTIVSSSLSLTKLQKASQSYTFNTQNIRINLNLLIDETSSPLNRVSNFGKLSLQKKEIENIFLHSFFFYFKTLKKEKRDVYWPIIISFVPIALQRRIVKLFLANQSWKEIRYSQIKTFLARQPKL